MLPKVSASLLWRQLEECSNFGSTEEKTIASDKWVFFWFLEEEELVDHVLLHCDKSQVV